MYDAVYMLWVGDFEEGITVQRHPAGTPSSFLSASSSLFVLHSNTPWLFPILYIGIHSELPFLLLLLNKQINMSSVRPPKGIEEAPSPWFNMPVTTYMFGFWSKPPLLDYAYAPLEAHSSFADPTQSGEFKGGLGLLQLVRYHDTPVGAYDELVVLPGYFEVPGAYTRRKKPLQLPR